MSYLAITNDGVCDYTGLTTLGLSTSRGDANSIGQFGSGFVHGVLTLLRNDLSPVVYCGNNRVDFFTEQAFINHSGGKKAYEQVHVKIGSEVERLSIALEFGELDWHDIKYSCREFISNALDQSNQDATEISVEIVDKIQPHPDKTIVGVPLTETVQDYYDDIDRHFLHFSPHISHQDSIIPKVKMGPPRIYRKGVFVKDIENEFTSLFDYNFGESLKIDESRNLDSYNAEYDVIQLIAKRKEIGDIFEAVVNGTQCWETNFSHWGVVDVCKWSDSVRHNWQKQWKKRYGDAVIAVHDQGPLINSARQQGHIVKTIKFTTWFKAMCNAKIPSLIDVLDEVNDKGHIKLDPDDNLITMRDRVWGWVELAEMTREKEKPQVRYFRTVQTDETGILGYVDNGIVYINEIGGSEQVMLEEIAHYVTGAGDNTRPFQDYAFQLSTVLAKNLF